MLYTLITLLLVFFTSLLFLPKFKKLVERQGLAINFLLSMVATLAGVLLAISISNYDANRKDKEDLVKLIDASIVSIEACAEYGEALLVHYKSLKQEQIPEQSFFIKNPMPYPEYVDVFLSQPLVGKNLSSNTLGDLNESVINLKRTIHSKPEMYVELLKRTKLMLLVERRYLKGEFNEEILELKLDEIVGKPLANETN